MKLKELKAKKATMLKDMRALLETAEAEDRDLTEQEQAQYTQMADNLDLLNNRIARIEEQEAQEREAASSVWDDNARISGGEPRIKNKEFASFGEQLQAVYAHYSGGETDPRLIRAASGSSEGSPADGGFLVQKTFADMIRDRMYNTGAILSRIRPPTPVTVGNGVKYNGIDETSRVNGSRSGGVQAYWAAEAATVTASRPKFRLMELDLKKLFALWYATDELLSDAGAMESMAMRAFENEIRFKTEDAIINGTGNGIPLGILKSNALVTVAKEGGQANDTVLKANIDKMWSRMFAANRANAVWLINQDVEPQLQALSQSVGTGGLPVYLPPGGLSQSPYSTLYGRPVIPVEYCETLGDLGDILFVDLSEYDAIEKGGIRQDSSMHVRFIYDEMTFRFIYRFDGQPSWHSALTPYKGSNTLSPYVALATR